MRGTTAYRAAVGVAVGAALLLMWLSLGVGVIGRDGDPANVMYFVVVAGGVLGALVARFRPRGMVRVLLGMALAQILVGVVALVAGLGEPWSGPVEIVGLTGIFVGLFGASAWLFGRAGLGGRGGSEGDAA